MKYNLTFFAGAFAAPQLLISFMPPHLQWYDVALSSLASGWFGGILSAVAMKYLME